MTNDRTLEHSDQALNVEFEQPSKLDWQTPELLNLAITSETEAIVGSGAAPA